MDGRFYPSGDGGAMDKVGGGRGIGKNVNIPWPTKGMGDGDYMYAFQQVVMPIAQEFEPDLVVVAAGFDAAAGDELGGCFVSPACYAHMTSQLMSLANGKIAVCLEGGYNFVAISKSALAVTRTLMGEPPDRLQLTQASDIAVRTVEKVKHIQSRYWHNIFPKGPNPMPGGEYLDYIIRAFQKISLYEKFKFSELHIIRDTISKSFEHQVLATRDYQLQERLLVLFHDVPEIQLEGAQTSTLFPAHEAKIHDPIPEYIEFAIANGFGVIDVYIPKVVTLPMNVTEGLSPEEKAKARQYIDSQNPGYVNIPYAEKKLDLARQESGKVARYIWENYIEPYDFKAESVVFLGSGNGVYPVTRLMSELPNEAVYQSTMRERENAQGAGGANAFSGTTTGMLAGVVGFVTDQPLRGVQNQANPWVTEWYRKNALVFVTEDHSVFTKKVSRSYGSLRKVERGDLAQVMLRDNVQQQCWEWIMERVGEPIKYEDTTSDEGKPTTVKARRLDSEAASAMSRSVTLGLGGDDVVMSTEK
jgi:histone deacetylase 6